MDHRSGVEGVVTGNVEVFDLNGRSAFVTGATRGIGAAIARALRQAGAAVHVHGRTIADAQEIATELGGTAWACDLEDSTALQGMLDEFLQSNENLDVLVNNAGVEMQSLPDNFDRSLWDQVFAVNVYAPAQLVSAFIPLLASSVNGSIVNVSSIHDRVPSFGNGPYASSKSALRMLTETLSVELGPHGIRVNSIAPGAIATDINKEVLERVGLEAFSKWIPIGRVGKPEDIGGVAVFLASDAARYISGATIVVDGAYSHNLVRYRPDDDSRGQES